MRSVTLRALLLVALSGLCPPCALAQDAERPVLGVLDFNTEGFSPEEVAKIKVLSEQLMIEFSNTGRYQVIERAKRDVILKEHGFPSTTPVFYDKLIESGRLQFFNDDLTKAGRFLSAQKIVGGALTKFEKEWFVEVRFLDVSVGFADRRVTWSHKKLDGLLAAIPSIVGKLIKPRRTRSLLTMGTYDKMMINHNLPKYGFLISATSFAAASAICWGVAQSDYSKYRKAHTDGEIAVYRDRVQSNDLAAYSCAGIALMSLGGWYYSRHHGERFSREGLAWDGDGDLTVRPGSRIEKLDPFKVKNRSDWTLGWAALTLTSASLTITLKGFAEDEYYRYTRAVEDNDIRNHKSSAKWLDVSTVLMAGATATCGYFWWKAERRERDQFQLGLVPDRKSSLGARPGLVYTWGF